MKKYIGIILSLFVSAALFSSCSKDGGDGSGGFSGDGTPVGTWHLSSWSGLTSADIYLSFSDDGSFDLYQRVYTPYYEHFDGTWSASGGVMSGTYSDGSMWHASYNVAFSDGGTVMSMTDVADGSDVSVYVSSEIPEDVLSGDLSLKSADPRPVL